MTTDGTNDACISVFDGLANASEQLTAFAVELRNKHGLTTARTRTELRRFQSGWRFQKWIEAPLGDEGAIAAVWAFELSEREGRWVLASSTSISPEIYDEDFPELFANDVPSLVESLDVAVRRLVSSFESGKEFGEKVRGLLREDSGS